MFRNVKYDCDFGRIFFYIVRKMNWLIDEQNLFYYFLFKFYKINQCIKIFVQIYFFGWIGLFDVCILYWFYIVKCFGF